MNVGEAHIPPIIFRIGNQKYMDESPEKWATSVGQLEGNGQKLAHETGPKPLEKTTIGSIGPLIGEEVPTEGEINLDWGEA